MTNATRFDLSRPCGTCPFRTDGRPILLAEERRYEIAAAIEGDDATFICHERMEYREDPEDGEDYVSGGPQCAGATLTAGPPQIMRIYDRLQGGRIYDRLQGGLEHPVVYPEPVPGVPWEDAMQWAADMKGWDV